LAAGVVLTVMVNRYENDDTITIPAWHLNTLPKVVNERIFSFVAPRRSEVIYQKYRAERQLFENQWHWDPDDYISRNQGYLLENYSMAEMEGYWEINDIFEEYKSTLKSEVAEDIARDQRNAIIRQERN